LSGNQNSDTFKGFKGLTIKEDIFSKLANKSANVSDANASGGADDENYDPHYEPIIKLPDEIVVKTGEEDEEKLYWERAKLYRFDPDTKEWKERGKFESEKKGFLCWVLIGPP
jgi:E3 SUMO-protein ligase RanBP2